MQQLLDRLNQIQPTGITGAVSGTTGTTVEVAGFAAPVGATVSIQQATGGTTLGEVIGFRDGLTLVYPLGTLAGIRRGATVTLESTTNGIRVGNSLLGRIVDGRGQPLDHGPALMDTSHIPIDQPAPQALARPMVDTPLATGIRAIDGLLTTGQGGRVGLFAGSGVGKTVLLGMIMRQTNADVCVLGMVGERGREVNEFVQRDLGEVGMKKSVLVVSTSDEPALLRIQAAKTATTIAEYFRDQGKHVLLVIDSLTRVAMAQREIGLAAGEPPTTRGYPPSIFSLLPQILERAGRTTSGSITGVYSVLTEGDDLDGPVSDTVRGLLDGHIVLSRKLAEKGHYPAIDVLQSVSRLMPQVVPEEQSQQTRCITELLAAYREHEDLISIGAYQAGANAIVDRALTCMPAIEEFTSQAINERVPYERSLQQLASLTEQATRRPTDTPSPTSSLHTPHERGPW